ncbi:hypothetical protein PM082_007823 [Marasmius tenuissimus]|nr:hypothetical protein PM082_007823 [Marasmius tenuissimus]
MDDMGFSLRLQGTNISVYFDLANDIYVNKSATRAECDFILAGSLEKVHVHTSSSNGRNRVHRRGAQKDGLENRVHIVDMETGKKTYEFYIAFDYVMYIVEEPDDDSYRPSHGAWEPPLVA